MKLSVFGDHLLVYLDPFITEKKTVDSVTGREFTLKLPDKHSEPVRIGTIVAAGDNIAPYKLGDRVMIEWHTGVRLHLVDSDIDGNPTNEDRHRILCSHEILARVDE